MEPFVRSPGAHTLLIREWEQAFPGLIAGFTLRTGGSSVPPYASLNLALHVGDDPERVRANRRTLAEWLGVPFSAWTCAHQVHGTRVVRVTEEQRGAGRNSMADVIPATDGLFTERAETLLVSYYADCVPLYFLDPESRAVGLAHAGWKGSVGRIAAEMVRALAENYGARPDRLRVAMGPAIGGCCYEVDEHVIARVREASPRWRECARDQQNGRWLLDLRALNRLILEEMGVPGGNILVSQWCTSCRNDLFFSHRKEAGKTGRMASFIGWLKGGDGRSECDYL